jgi:hypothetical protein
MKTNWVTVKPAVCLAVVELLESKTRITTKFGMFAELGAQRFKLFSQ